MAQPTTFNTLSNCWIFLHADLDDITNEPKLGPRLFLEGELSGKELDLYDIENLWWSLYPNDYAYHGYVAFHNIKTENFVQALMGGHCQWIPTTYKACSLFRSRDQNLYKNTWDLFCFDYQSKHKDTFDMDDLNLLHLIRSCLELSPDKIEYNNVINLLRKLQQQIKCEIIIIYSFYSYPSIP